MDNQENSTIGIKREDLEGFTKVETSSTQETSKPAVEDNKKTLQHKPEEAGWGAFPRSLMGAIKEDFPTSIFVLILLGYVIIETFGKEGINFSEYIKFIVILFVFYGVFKVLSGEGLIERFIDFINKKKVFIGVILILIIDSIINHWAYVQWFLNFISDLFKSKP